MRILVVSSKVGRSPSEITYSFVFDEIIRLVRRGIEVHVARSKFEGSGYSYGIYFHDLRNDIMLTAIPYTLKVLKCYPFISLLRIPINIYRTSIYSYSIHKLIEEIEPDVIHAHFAYPEGWVAALAKLSLNTSTPLVVTLHGYDILTEPSIGYGIRLYKHYDLIVRKVLEKADAVIVASRAVFSEVTKLCSKKDKIYLIPNGVDLKRFNPNIDGTCIRRKLDVKNKYIVFTVRHHEPKYGIEYLIRAASLVLKEKKDVVFIIGGDGSLRPYYEELASKLGVRNRIVFTGRIPQAELPYYYAASDVVVVPSLQEAWGLVVTEAMASGKPVIGTRVGGIVDQIIDGYNGFLVPPRDPRAIAEKILWLIENPDEIKRIGMNGRKLAEEKFDIEKRVDRIVELYKELLR